MRDPKEPPDKSLVKADDSDINSFLNLTEGLARELERKTEGLLDGDTTETTARKVHREPGRHSRQV